MNGKRPLLILASVPAAILLLLLLGQSSGTPLAKANLPAIPAMAPPANDDFSAARAVNSFPYQDSLDTQMATTAAADPDLPCGPSGKGFGSVWYSVTPKANVLLTADTFGSNYDTVLAVWQQGFGTLTDVACSDNSGYGLASQVVDVPLAQNDTYYIELAGYEGFLGDLVLNLNLVPDSASIGHDIDLAAGWNMISSYVEPDDPALATLLAGIEPNMVLMKNGSGEVYWPAMGINDLANWQSDFGYQIFMDARDTLTVLGQRVEPSSLVLNLSLGWNLISYPRAMPMNPSLALDGIVGPNTMAKNGSGQVYWPAYALDTIGEMQPGEGYQLHMTEPAALTFPGATYSGPEYEHPLRALNSIDGPLPLFDTLNDAQGRRYVIGEGASATGEAAEVDQQSGLFLAARRPMTTPDYDKTDPPLTLPPPPVISPALAALLPTLSPHETLQIVIIIEDPLPPVQEQLERTIASGRVQTPEEVKQLRDQFRARRQERMVGLLLPAVQKVRDAGGQVDFACQNVPCLIATLPAGQITPLAGGTNEIQSMDLSHPVLPNDQEPGGFQAPPTLITGVTVRHGLQIQQFVENSYDGNGLNDQSEADNIMIAVVEPGQGYAEHDGFRESGPGSSFRYATGGGSTGKWQCDNDGCQAVNSFAAPGNHATGAAGLAMGDLEQGQIPGIPVPVRPTASGYAREAVAHLYAFTSGSSGAVSTLDHIGGLSSAQKKPDIISNSWGYFDQPQCSGGGAVAQAANRLYEDGIAVISAAHNFGGSANDCNVTAPGSAIGSFTVGAHLWGYEGDPNTVRTAGIYDNMAGNASSWGGHATAGQDRSIIDITATGTRANKFNTGGSYSQGGIICCTSLATPQVSGAAANFMDFYHHEYSNFIDHPGSLYTNLLLMGDRQGVSGKINSRADHLWGAGRLRMRMFDGVGMDPPWYYFNGFSCISDGEVWDFPIGEGTNLPGDIDAIKAAAYWYDTRHDGSLGSGAGSVADVDMHIINVPTGQPIVTDSDSYDNKARVYYEDAGGLNLTLRLIGYNVAGHDDPLCGSDAIRVFFAYFAEDSDREAPTYNPITGTGIFPEGT